MSTSLEDPLAPAPAAPPPAPPPAGLLNVLGLAFGVSVTVGGCIGTGILVAPGLVATHLPNVWLYLGAWLAGGLYVLLGAVAVAELAAMTPRSGGFYVYVRRALGEQAGFVTGWTHWLALCSGAAFVSITLGKFFALLFPWLRGYERAVAATTVAGLALLHWRGVRQAGRIQEVTTLVKGVAFLALIAAFFALGQAGAEEAAAPAVAGWALVGGALIALQAILQAYDGWEAAIYFGEEIRRPGLNLPRSLFVGTLTVLALYLLVNLALLCALPLGRVAGQEMALAAAAQAVFGASGGQLFLALAVASVLVSCNAGTLQTPRVLYAMSRDGLVFAAASRVNAGGTPTVALAVTTASILVFLAAATFEALLAALAFFLITGYALMFVALFVLRWREPAAERPYRAWGHPWTTGLALAGSLVYLGVSVGRETTSSLIALALVAASVPGYYLVRRARRQPAAGEASPVAPSHLGVIPSPSSRSSSPGASA